MFCARCANSVVSESWSGFLPKRHTKWPFLATVSLATLHIHLSSLSHKVMHYSMPKWPLFDHLTNLTLKWPVFHYMQCLALRNPLWLPVWLPFSVYMHYWSPPIPHPFIPKSPAWPIPRYARYACTCNAFYAHNAQNGFDPSYDYATLSVCTFNYCKQKTNLKTQTRLTKIAWKWKWAGGTQPPK